MSGAIGEGTGCGELLCEPLGDRGRSRRHGDGYQFNQELTGVQASYPTATEGVVCTTQTEIEGGVKDGGAKRCPIGYRVVTSLSGQQTRDEVQKQRRHAGHVGRRRRGDEERARKAGRAGHRDAVDGRHVGLDGPIVGWAAAAEGLDFVNARVGRVDGAHRDHAAAASLCAGTLLLLVL